MAVSSVVSVDWLQENLQQVRVVDASWHLPPTGRNGAEEFLNAHIPGAVYFDIDVCATTGDLPHTLPSASTFAQYVAKLGITEQDHVVVYDATGWFSAPRVWWMFRHFGCATVSVLDGGFAAWSGRAFAIESGLQSPTPTTFKTSEPDGSAFQVVVASDVLEASQTGDSAIVDARPAARFHAHEKEFRPGLRSGHIPNSENIPFGDLIENGFLKSDEDLRAVFNAAGITGEKPVISSCGSGVTAAVLLLAMERIGFADLSLYDGSWSEWGSLEALPIVSQ